MSFYFTYDADKTPEANITMLGTSLSTHLSSLDVTWSAKFNEAKTVFDNIDNSIDSASQRIADAVETFPEKLAEALKQSVDDAAIDAMRRELATLVLENTKLKRLVEEIEENDAGRDTPKEQGADSDQGDTSGGEGQVEAQSSTPDSEGEEDGQLEGRAGQDDRDEDS